jgi:hypothetical protein
MKNTRLQIINNSNLCNYYKEFLIQNPEEELPDTPGWKNNLNYMFWIHGKHKEFRKLNGYPSDCYPDKKYQENFINWLKI